MTSTADPLSRALAEAVAGKRQPLYDLLCRGSRLPGIRIEHMAFGRHRLVTLNTITPIGDSEIEESYAIYWTHPLFNLLKPLGRAIVGTFAAQDGGALRRQALGAKYDPPVMLIDDADTQAKWYYRLKQEYARACAEQRPFVNPVQARVLRFRS